jgi:hypothetical protein
MRHSYLRTMVLGIVVSFGVFTTACKGKKNTETNYDTSTAVTAPVPAPAPVEISTDDSLKNGVVDATKDYPGVTATVNNGEITLTGDIERTRLPNLMQSLNSLRPKKINNNLTIK